MPGAETYAPPTSVDNGSSFQPAALTPGSTAGLADWLASDHAAPGMSMVQLLDVATLPPAASAKGRLARFDDAGSPKVAISDGTSWHALVVGSVL